MTEKEKEELARVMTSIEMLLVLAKSNIEVGQFLVETSGVCERTQKVLWQSRKALNEACAMFDGLMGTKEEGGEG